MTPDVRSLMHKQQALERVAENVRAKSPKIGSVGVSGIAIDPEKNALRLYWHGAVPEAVAAEIAAARSQGMTVTVESAPYTEVQLLAEIERLSKLPLFPGARTGRRSMALGPKPDGSGISVGISGLSADTSMAEARQTVPALDSKIPLTVTRMSKPALAFRWFDTSPFWGGALMINGLSCSTGFGATGNNGASTYLVTAAHCGTGTWRTGAVETPEGTTIQNTFGSTISAGRDLQHDAQLIRPGAGFSAGNAVYYGASINGDTGNLGSNTGITVSGRVSNAVGARICTSGAFSGTICNIQIQLTNQSLVFDPPENGVSTMNSMVVADKVLDDSGVFTAAGQGDSGGPVFDIISEKARARGIIAAVSTGNWIGPCAGWAPSGRICSRRVWFGDITVIVNTVGVRINTG